MVNNRDRYPFSNEWDYEASIETIDLNDEMEQDIRIGNGFLISPSNKSIKKDLKDPDGIFSYRFGPTLNDMNPFIDRYKCRCVTGGLKGRVSHGMTCPICGARCEFVDDNFEYFGWMIIDKPYVVIHAAYYKKIERFIGRKGAAVNGKKRSRLENILEVVDIKDIDGHSTELENKPKNEPYYGIGMIDFYERFDEIMAYYYKIQTNKKESYDDIIQNKHKIFTNSIPVFTTLLRPTDIRDNTMSYEPTNAMYVIINKLRTQINRNKTRMDRDKKSKNQNLYKLQMKYMELYDEIGAGLSGKKGDFRGLMGGRYNFTSREVIVQDPNLRIDEITLSYKALVIIMEQRIKNIINKLYNMSIAEAHNIWYDAVVNNKNTDGIVKGIIESIIQHYKDKGLPGIPFIINRNPTIGYGSILQMFCIGFTETYTMALPLQVLPLLAADFDGDVLNILHIINDTFFKIAYSIYNPRNAFYISRNDGYFNSSVSMQRDTLINANTLESLGKGAYTQEELAVIRSVSKRNKELYY